VFSYCRWRNFPSDGAHQREPECLFFSLVICLFSVTSFCVLPKTFLQLRRLSHNGFFFLFPPLTRYRQGHRFEFAFILSDVGFHLVSDPLSDSRVYFRAAYYVFPLLYPSHHLFSGFPTSISFATIQAPPQTEKHFPIIVWRCYILFDLPLIGPMFCCVII